MFIKKLFLMVFILVNFSFVAFLGAAEVKVSSDKSISSQSNANKKNTEPVKTAAGKENRTVSNTNLFTISEFTKEVNLQPGSYYDQNDMDDCLGGPIELLTSERGALTISLGENILVGGIVKGENSETESSSSCQSIFRTIYKDKSIHSLFENKCKGTPDIFTERKIKFLTDKKGKSVIHYKFVSREAKKTMKSFSCNLVQEL